MKKKVFLIIGIIATAFTTLASINVLLFYQIRDNPRDHVAGSYICNNAEFVEKYGEPYSIGRYIAVSKEKTENSVFVPYSVDTDDYCVIVYVELQKNEGGNYTALSMRVLEVTENEDKI